MNDRLPLRRRNGEVVAYTLVDAEDWVRYSKWRWHLNSEGYACRVQRGPGKSRTVRLHREILGLSFGDPRQSDHINHDRLDNRRSNLRVVTLAENNLNASGRGGVSRFHGVYRDRKTWVAQVKIAGVKHIVGRFREEEDAARAAEEFRRERLGSFRAS